METLVAMSLEDIDVEVVAVSTLAGALEEARRTLPRVVLLDLAVGNGHERGVLDDDVFALGRLLCGLVLGRLILRESRQGNRYQEKESNVWEETEAASHDGSFRMAN